MYLLFNVVHSLAAIVCMHEFKDLNEVLFVEPMRLVAENLFSKRDEPAMGMNQSVPTMGICPFMINALCFSSR